MIEKLPCNFSHKFYKGFLNKIKMKTRFIFLLCFCFFLLVNIAVAVLVVKYSSRGSRGEPNKNFIPKKTAPVVRVTAPAANSALSQSVKFEESDENFKLATWKNGTLTLTHFPVNVSLLNRNSEFILAKNPISVKGLMETINVSFLNEKKEENYSISIDAGECKLFQKNQNDFSKIYFDSVFEGAEDSTLIFLPSKNELNMRYRGVNLNPMENFNIEENHFLVINTNKTAPLQLQLLENASSTSTPEPPPMGPLDIYKQ